MGLTQTSLTPQGVELTSNRLSISQITRRANEEGKAWSERLQARKKDTGRLPPFTLLAGIQEQRIKSQARLQG